MGRRHPGILDCLSGAVATGSGRVSGALLYNAKTVLNQATFEAARISSVRHGDTAPMQEELARRLAGFYGPTGTAAEYTAAYAQAMTDVVTPVTAGERVGSAPASAYSTPPVKPSMTSVKTLMANAKSPMPTSSAAVPPSADLAGQSARCQPAQD